MFKKIFTTLFLFTIITSSLVTTKAEEILFVPTLDESYSDDSSLFMFSELPEFDKLSFDFSGEISTNLTADYCVITKNTLYYDEYSGECDSSNSTFISCGKTCSYYQVYKVG